MLCVVNTFHNHLLVALGTPALAQAETNLPQALEESLL
jgi:hypothetical protein